MKMFGQENIGKPDIEIASNEKQLIEFLQNHLEEGEIPPVSSVLVSLHPKAVIGDVENAPVAIVESGALRRHIRKNDRKTDTEISPSVLQKINAALGGEQQ